MSCFWRKCARVLRWFIAPNPRIAGQNIPARFAESTHHGFPRDIHRKKEAEKIKFQPRGLKYCFHAY
jgi:hypothetical protein